VEVVDFECKLIWNERELIWCILGN